MEVVLFLFSRWAKARLRFLTSPFRMVYQKVVMVDQARQAEAEPPAAAALFTSTKAPS
jgi:hypothetical protein